MSKQKYTTKIRQEYLKQGLQPCIKCDQVKPISEFHKDKSTKSGHTKRCRGCVSNSKGIRYTAKIRLEYLEQDVQPCAKCDEIKSVNEFYSLAKSETGYDYYCKDCTRELAGNEKCKKYTTKIRLIYLEQGLQPCSACDEVKPISEFYTGSTIIGYAHLCKSCLLILHQTDRYKKGTSTYNTSAKGVAARKRHYNTPKGKASAMKAYRKRRARKRQVEEDYTSIDEKITYAVFGKECIKCGTETALQIDHFTPLCRGNALTVSNAVPLCAPCNRKKWAFNPRDFFSEIEIKKIEEKFVVAQNMRRSCV